MSRCNQEADLKSFANKQPRRQSISRATSKRFHRSEKNPPDVRVSPLEATEPIALARSIFQVKCNLR